MTENKATMRTCSREAARPRRRACTMPHTSRAMTATSRSTVAAFVSSSVTTTSCVGGIGVRPASTTKVTSAESSASATATTPSARGIHPDVGAAAAFISSVVAAWPMLVIDSSRPKRQPAQRVEIRPLRCPLIDGSSRLLMLLYNKVAGLRQFRGAPSRPVADRHHSNARIKNASAATAEDLNIEIADFLPQGIAIDPEQIRRADLVAAGGCQSHREERMLDLAQDTVVKAGGRQSVAESREVRG